MRKYVIILVLSLVIQALAAQPAQLESACGETVKDHQGNVYKTVKIGKQCWMAENMRCTTSPTGKKWEKNPTFSASEAMFASYVASPNNSNYGLLYNWSSAMDLGVNECFTHNSSTHHRGICPKGWHLPSSSEWSTLFNASGGTHKAGAALKGDKSLWSAPAVANANPNNFSALPAGLYTENKLEENGKSAFFWSASAYDELNAWQCGVFHHNSDSYNCMEYKCYGCSVRCLKD